MTNQAPILQVRDLKSYFTTRLGPARAVDGISFDIYPGEIYALVGESGCGKSVTALSILQLLARPAGYIAGGQILYQGRDIARYPPVRMRKIRGKEISMIFQEPMTALNPVFTVGNQVNEAIKLHDRVRAADARKRGIAMLDQVGIPDAEACYDVYPHQLSGGMRQRVMIAMALVCRPKLLIADEPTTALDVTIQAQILELLRDLRQKTGAAVLLITHDMGVVRENADRVGVMYAGRMAEEAPVDRLFAQPAHPYTELLMRALPTQVQRGRRLDTIKGMAPKATEVIPGCPFANRCPLVLSYCAEKALQRTVLEPGHCVFCHLFPVAENEQRAPIRRQPGDIQTPAAGASATVLQIQNLKTYFPIRKGFFKRTVGYVRAVDGVSMELRRGETIALVGESGCGKTTLGKSIVRLLTPMSGSILYADADLATLKQRSLKPTRKRIQFVFQDPFSSMDPRQVIADLIAEGMQTHHIGANHAERVKRAEELLERVGMDRAGIHRYPHEFSGGQRQRIVLARALATNPELIICDEPTSALDVSVQAQILNLLKDLQNEFGLSYIFITHNLSIVEYLADRIAVMYLGRVVEEGKAEQILGRPRHPYTRVLLSAAPHADAAAARKKIVIEGDIPSPANPPRGCHFHPRCPFAVADCKRIDPALETAKGDDPDHRAACIRKDELDLTAAVPG
jgi:peptide/nickel transport system ATP-binding protein